MERGDCRLVIARRPVNSEQCVTLSKLGRAGGSSENRCVVQVRDWVRGLTETRDFSNLRHLFSMEWLARVMPQGDSQNALLKV